jgi:hypothetical protein
MRRFIINCASSSDTTWVIGKWDGDGSRMTGTTLIKKLKSEKSKREETNSSISAQMGG